MPFLERRNSSDSSDSSSSSSDSTNSQCYSSSESFWEESDSLDPKVVPVVPSPFNGAVRLTLPPIICPCPTPASLQPTYYPNPYPIMPNVINTNLNQARFDVSNTVSQTVTDTKIVDQPKVVKETITTTPMGNYTEKVTIREVVHQPSMVQKVIEKKFTD